MANLSEWLCSETNFVPYIDSHNQSLWHLSDCFQSLAIISPIYALLAVISSLLIGWTSGLDQTYDYSNVVLMRRLFKSKALIVITIVLIVLIDSIVISIEFNQMNAFYITIAIEIISLNIHLFYLFLKVCKNQLSNSSQTNTAINAIIILIIISLINQIYTQIVQQNHVLHQLVCGSIVLILWSMYLSLNIIIGHKFKSSPIERPLIESNEEINDIFNSIDNQLSNDENVNFISKVMFLWVAPLMRKGIERQINSHNDLFRIPDKLMAKTVWQKFNTVFNPSPVSSNESDLKTKSLLKSLLRCYGKEFLFIGCLKFSSDILSFSGPLILNKVIQYLESNDHNSKDGFYYGIALFVSTFVASVFISLFNFYVNNICLKIKSSIITTIYKKIFSVRTNTLNTYFSTGEILNFASTDTDRVVNFCPSILQFISLPIQLSVTLYLLYQQLGIAFISGVIFTIILIPINRWICNKIGDLSSKMMEWKDRRIKLMSEILSGIRVIKMHGWEDIFKNRINHLREKEMKYLKGRKYLDAFCVYFWATTPVLISSFVFGTFVLLNGQLTAPIVFTSLALLGMLIVPLNAFPWVLNGLMESWISIKRLQKLFDLQPLEVDKHYNHVLIDSNNKVEALGNSFNCSESTNANNRFTLGPIDMTLTNNMFIGVIGFVGSGKSSLLNALLGEMQRIGGKLGISRSDLESGIGIVTQEPWIQNTTVMENILFGKTLDAERYHSVLDACALIDDLNTFPNGDLTVIGDRGVTLSGGQKTRISLARAVYQDFDIYLIDDPFASVDIHVGQHIYNKCICGLLSKKTKILCTHQHKYLLRADLILKLDSGQIVASDSPQNLLEVKEKSKISDENNDQELSVFETNDVFDSMAKEEERNEGVVKRDVWLGYAKSVGLCLSAIILSSILLMQMSKSASDCWLAFWTSNNRLNMGSNTSINYLLVFIGIAAINSVLTLIRSFVFAYGGVVAAFSLHSKLFEVILCAPVLFFDITPFGRIINRFSSDLYNIDDALPFTLNIFLSQFYSLLASVLITIYGLPYMTFLIIPLSIPYYFIQRYYRWTSRELKRLTAVSLSPIYAQLDETLQGLVTIRAFAGTNRFFNDLCHKLDINNKTQYSSAAGQQWLNLRLQLLGVVISSGVVLIAVGLHYWSNQTVDSGLVGLALVYSLSVTALLNGSVQSFAQTEMDMVSVERVMQYINDIQSEESIELLDDQSGVNCDPWPNKGVIQYECVSLRYRLDLRLALERVSFTTKPYEKIGIVGRTGSGKSSLFQVLFRLVDIEEGNISIDGRDISTISLKHLRSSLFIIPQEPFLFSGSIRDNLDPRSQYSDNEIWHSLRECHLESLVLGLGGLNANISERGRDLSCGQRQLLCLVRALLSRAKVLCFDEATANVDSTTEKLIQQTVRHVLTSATVLFVAHKIESVLDCDRIIVMDDSRIAEIGAPDGLMHNSNSMFYSLCNR